MTTHGSDSSKLVLALRWSYFWDIENTVSVLLRSDPLILMSGFWGNNNLRFYCIIMFIISDKAYRYYANISLVTVSFFRSVSGCWSYVTQTLQPRWNKSWGAYKNHCTKWTSKEPLYCYQNYRKRKPRKGCEAFLKQSVQYFCVYSGVGHLANIPLTLLYIAELG